MRLQCIKRAQIAAIIVSFYLVIASANFTTLHAADSGPAPVILQADEIDLGDALAGVNGFLIERSHFDRSLERVADYSSAADRQALAFDVLNTMIEQELIIQFASSVEIEFNDDDITAEIDSLKDSLRNSTWESWLAKNRYTAPEFRIALHAQLINAAVRDNVTAYLYDSVEHVHARHILLASESQAHSVMKLLAAGESFTGLARALSGDVSTRDRGGDLRWFIEGELLDDNLGDAAFSLEPGLIDGPIVTRLGYHILEVLGREQRMIADERIPFLAERIFDRWLQDQVEAAEIVLNLEALEEIGQSNP